MSELITIKEILATAAEASSKAFELQAGRHIAFQASINLGAFFCLLCFGHEH